MPLRERRKEERQRVTFLFLYTPCVSAAPLKCMGVSSQKDYVQCRMERAQRQLSHWDIVKKKTKKTLGPKRINSRVGESVREAKPLNGNIRRIVPRAKDWDDPPGPYFNSDKAVFFLGQ